MPACARQVEIDMRVDLWPARGTLGVLGDKQRCDREVAVDMLPCCRRGAGVAGAARRDHDGYSDAPGRPVLPDGALFHVSLTLRKILKRRAAESPTSRSA